MNIIQWDEQLFLYLNHLGNSQWDTFWLIVTNKKTWIFLYVSLVFFIFKRYGWKSSLIILLLAGAMILCTDQISNLYKETLIKRLRPCKDPEISSMVRLVKDYCGGKYGYFSAHASNHMGIAVYVGLLFKKHKWVLPLLMVWAMFIAYSRVYIGVHYPLDVITGALLGSLLAIFFFQLQQILIRKWT